jgi:hypothetical protein
MGVAVRGGVVKQRAPADRASVGWSGRFLLSFGWWRVQSHVQQHNTMQHSAPRRKKRRPPVVRVGPHVQAPLHNGGQRVQVAAARRQVAGADAVLRGGVKGGWRGVKWEGEGEEGYVRQSHSCSALFSQMVSSASPPNPHRPRAFDQGRLPPRSGSGAPPRARRLPPVGFFGRAQKFSDKDQPCKPTAARRAQSTVCSHTPCSHYSPPAGACSRARPAGSGLWLSPGLCCGGRTAAGPPDIVLTRIGADPACVLHPYQKPQPQTPTNLTLTLPTSAAISSGVLP